jgi:hypothetical protein
MLSEHPDNNAMHDEWIAWRAVCFELERASAAIYINDEPRLHAALVLWGEAIAALRRTQDPTDCERWLVEAAERLKEVLDR